MTGSLEIIGACLVSFLVGSWSGARVADWVRAGVRDDREATARLADEVAADLVGTRFASSWSRREPGASRPMRQRTSLEWDRLVGEALRSQREGDDDEAA